MSRKLNCFVYNDSNLRYYSQCLLRRLAMKKEKKENILGSICNAIYQIWQGDHAIVYFSFYKNITEEIFGALFGI